MRHGNEVQPSRTPQRWYEHCYSSGLQGTPITMSNTSSARLCALFALAAVWGAAPGVVRAAPPPPAAGDVTLTAERARLRAQLDGVNAEIDALKRSTRGVGDDYRLRARLADAEALARRLIDIEARLGLRAPAAEPGPLPVASPADGPSDLEAKADILDDRARRVRLEAEALDRRVGQLKGPQDLRRRAADLDRDPFAPLEGSKRRVVTISAADSAGHTSFAPQSPTSNSGPQPPVERPGVGVTGSPASTGNNAATTSAGSTPPTPLTGPPPTALSLELRDLLDPATVADIRRLEGAKPQAASVQVLERAVAALRARAAALDGQARAMRQTARTPH
jgi:hypothetical protein